MREEAAVIICYCSYNHVVPREEQEKNMSGQTLKDNKKNQRKKESKIIPKKVFLYF